MPIAAASITATARSVPGGTYAYRFNVVFDNSYANAGGGDHGEPISPAIFALDSIDDIEPFVLRNAAGTSAFLGSYDRANSRLQVWKSNGTTDLIPVANAVDLSGYTAELRVHGAGVATA